MEKKERKGASRSSQAWNYIYKKSKGTFNPDAKCQSMENFNKPSASSQEYMSSSSEDETKGGETWIFLNALYVDSKACEDWIQCSGWQKWAHKACSKAEEEDNAFLCDFCPGIELIQRSYFHFIN